MAKCGPRSTNTEKKRPNEYHLIFCCCHFTLSSRCLQWPANPLIPPQTDSSQVNCCKTARTTTHFHHQQQIISNKTSQTGPNRRADMRLSIRREWSRIFFANLAATAWFMLPPYRLRSRSLFRRKEKKIWMANNNAQSTRTTQKR